MERCEAPTKNGAPCRRPRRLCDFESHLRWRARGEEEPPPPDQTAPSRKRSVPAAVAANDIPGVAWWALSSLAEGSLDSRDGAVMASLLRVLLAAGESGPGDDEVLREVSLRGLLMHGVPPRNEAEWALLEARFSPEAIAEARRWELLFERDALDGEDPGVLGEE